MSRAGRHSPRLLASDDPAAGGLAAIRPGDGGDGVVRVVRIEAEDTATALAELAWAIDRAAETVIVPDLEAARDFVIVREALAGRREVDPALALDPGLRREPPDAG